MKVLAITATCGRHRCLERAVGLFLDQDYKDKHLLIYQNSEVPQVLDESVDKSQVTLVNQHIDSATGKRYENLGAIYIDALKHIPEDIDLIYFADDDDLFLPNHISAGVRGYLKGGKKAYKPERSYYRSSNGVQLVGNNLEPSIFVDVHVIKEQGFHLETSVQHLKWVDWLRDNDELFVDPLGTPTLCYNWGDSNIPTFKTSGNQGHPENFNNYRNFSKEHGDGIITPLPKEELSQYYKEILR